MVKYITNENEKFYIYNILIILYYKILAFSPNSLYRFTFSLFHFLKTKVPHMALWRVLCQKQVKWMMSQTLVFGHFSPEKVGFSPKITHFKQ